MQRAVFVTWLILAGLSLAACSNGPSAGPTSSARLADLISTPHCGADPYGAKKTDARVGTLPMAPPQDPIDYRAGVILIVDHPLGEPREIASVRRGLTFYFAGAFVNDGLKSWQAVDLEKKIVISVQRRIFDKRAHTRSFGDPTFPAYVSNMTPPPIYARKWSDAQRTEEEVITINNLMPDAEEAILCISNLAWGTPRIRPGTFPMATDTFASNFTLLDFDSDSKKSFEKAAPPSGALDWLFRRVSEDQIKYEWPLY